MPIYAYYDGGTGPLWIDVHGWCNTATSTATTSSWYPFGGATYTTPILSTISQPVWFRHVSREAEEELQWVVSQPRLTDYRPAAPAIISERSEAQRQLQEAQAREATARRQAETNRIEHARVRARELLLEHLTPEQRRMFESNGWFIVEGGKSKKRYKIHTNQVAGNIDVLKEDSKVIERICCHCDYSIPYHDQHLAQKLMLEHAEDDFLRIANVRRYA